MTCNKCDKKGTRVWTIPDPYYGYGHAATLFCKDCKPDNIFMTSFHTYEPNQDDYYLGITKKTPYPWAWCGGTDPEKHGFLCFDCNKLCPVSRGGGFKHMHVYLEEGVEMPEKYRHRSFPSSRAFIVCERCGLVRYEKNRHTKSAVTADVITYNAS